MLNLSRIEAGGAGWDDAEPDASLLSRRAVLFTVGALYATQYIPLIFAITALPVVLRLEGQSATSIGIIQLVALPYIFKFLWSPLIDKYAPKRDHYKSWIRILSAVHVAALVLLSTLDPSGSIIPLMAILFLATLSVSTQDIAVDALTIRLLRKSDRALGASFQSAGSYIGAIVGAGLFLAAYDRLGWQAALLIQAAIFAIPIFALMLVREPSRPRTAAPVTMKNAFRFFKSHRMGRWIAILAVFRLPLVVLMLPMQIGLVDVGLTSEEIGVWMGLIAMSAATAVAIGSGPFMRRLPRLTALYFSAGVSVLATLSVLGLSLTSHESLRYGLVIAWAALALSDVVIFAGAMDKVRPEMPGFDFSIQLAFLGFAQALSEPLVGATIDAFGTAPVFVFACIVSLIPVAVLWLAVAPPYRARRGIDGDYVVSTGTMPTSNANEVLERASKDFADHGLTVRSVGRGHIRIQEMGCTLDMRADDRGLDMRVETPSDNLMTMVRDEVVEHISEVAPLDAKSLRWVGGIEAGTLPANFRVLHPVARREVFPGLIRVTLEGVNVDGLDAEGIHLKLMMPLTADRLPVWPIIGDTGGIVWPDGEDKLHARYVTIRAVRINARQIDVDIAHHEDGLISGWAARNGDTREVGVMGPGGDARLSLTDNIVLAADETGLPALARLVESVSGAATGHVVVAAPSLDVLRAYLPETTLKLHAIHPGRFAEEVAEQIASLATTSVTYGWFAGEFTSAQAVRDVFKKQLALSKGRQLSVAYWRRGEPGHSSQIE
ncbi:MAG: MFS transporter [Pseudomonadota bacterium]